MNCLKAEEHFSEYLEDAFDYQTIKAFDIHLADCETCRHELTLFQKSVDLLRQLPQIEPSSDLDVALQTRLANIQVETISLRRRILEAIRAQPIWTFGGLATVMLVVVAGIFLYQNAFVGKVPQDGRVAVTDLAGKQQNATPLSPRYFAQPASRIEKMPVAVPRLNIERAFEYSFNFPALEELDVREKLQSRRMEQHYILQTVNYTDVPTSGGL